MLTQLPTDERSFIPNPSHWEELHRIYGIKGATFSSSENTGGNVMHDIYNLPDGRILALYDYGALICRSMLHWLDGDYQAIHEWDKSHLYLSDCTSLEDFQGVWANNEELIFNDIGSADELLAANPDVPEREWVVMFIDEWDATQEEEREFDERTGYGGRL